MRRRQLQRRSWHRQGRASQCKRRERASSAAYRGARSVDATIAHCCAVAMKRAPFATAAAAAAADDLHSRHRDQLPISNNNKKKRRKQTCAVAAAHANAGLFCSTPPIEACARAHATCCSAAEDCKLIKCWRSLIRVCIATSKCAF